MFKFVGSLSCALLLGLLLLAACSEELTPTSTVPGSTVVPAPSEPAPTSTPAPSVTPGIAALPATASATAPATPTPAATRTPASVAVAATATAGPVPSPTASVPPSLTATPATAASPTAAPALMVPLQPVRRPGGTLTVGVLENEFKTRNYSPYAADLNETSRHLQRLVWNARLLYRDPINLEWKPLAARGKPTVDSDGRRYAFQLKDDLLWSDGTPITSKDYIYAFNNAIRPENRFRDLNQLQLVSLIDGPDLRTIVFTFNTPAVNALEVLNLLEPLPSHIWNRYPFAASERNPELTRPTVTSGPFRPDVTGLNFAANTAGPLARPNIERVVVRPFTDLRGVQDSIKAGTISWAFVTFPPAALLQFKENPQLTIYRWNPLEAGQRYIGYNLDNSFLSSRAVRQALSRTVDVRTLVATVENGLAVEQSGFLPAGAEFALKPPAAPRFNMRFARDEMRMAGYIQRSQDDRLGDAIGKPVPALELIYQDGSAETEALAIYLRQQYQQLGLVLNLNKLEAATYLKRQSNQAYDLDLGTLRPDGSPEPDDYKNWFSSQGSLNNTGYASSQVDTLFAEAGRLPAGDRAARRQVFERLQRIIEDDVPVFFLYTLQVFTVMNNSVDPGGAGSVNLPRWQLAWDAFPAYLNWYIA